jgi:hypothetical protein
MSSSSGWDHRDAPAGAGSGLGEIAVPTSPHPVAITDTLSAIAAISIRI